jgi:hypothetical protein
MGVIRISAIYDEQRTARGSGKPYSVRVVEGKKAGSDKDWMQPIFMNNKFLLDKLNQFGKGEYANFVYEKNTKNGRDVFDLVDIREPDPEYVEKLESGEVVDSRVKTSSGGSGKSSSANKGGSSLTKEEWAEKDRAKNMGIAKAVALKAAVELSAGKKGSVTTDELIDVANAFLPYLLDTEPLAEAPPWDTDGDDPLAPPTE